MEDKVIYLKNGKGITLSTLVPNDPTNPTGSTWSNIDMKVSILVPQTEAAWDSIGEGNYLTWELNGGTVIKCNAYKHPINNKKMFGFDFLYADGSELLYTSDQAGFSTAETYPTTDNRYGNRGVGLLYIDSIKSFKIKTFFDYASKWALSCSASSNDITFIDFASIDPNSDYGIYGDIRVYPYNYEYVFVQPNVNTYYNYEKLIGEGGEDQPDPMDQGGNSTTGGGGGDFDDDSDDILVPSLPSISSLSTGMVKLFAPTQAQMAAFADYLWNYSLTEVNVPLKILKSVLADPTDFIIMSGILPVEVEGTATNIKLMNIDTGLTMNQIFNQYYEFDFGTISCNEYWGSALDYSPFTKIQLYLPYVGIVDMSTDDLMGRSINIKYHIDVFSGSFTVFISAFDNRFHSVVATFSGNCLTPVPVTASPFKEMYKAAVGAAGMVALAAVGSGGAMAGSAAASQSKPSNDDKSSAVGASMGASIGTALFNGAASVLSAKGNVMKSNNIGETAGFMSVKKPYLIITRPIQCLPKDYRKMSGYPSYINVNLGSISGYTEVDKIHLEAVEGSTLIQGATQSELDELTVCLNNGFIC